MFIVWILFKLELATVLHELLELHWVALTQFLERGLDLLLLDVVVLIILVSAWQTLPWEGSSQEVEKDVTDRFKIVPP